MKNQTNLEKNNFAAKALTFAMLAISLVASSEAFAQSRPIHPGGGQAVHLSWTFWGAATTEEECTQTLQNYLVQQTPIDKQETADKFNTTPDQITVKPMAIKNDVPLEATEQGVFDQPSSDQTTCQNSALDAAKKQALSDCQAQFSATCEVDESESTVNYSTYKKFLGIFDHQVYSKCTAFATARVPSDSDLKVGCSMDVIFEYVIN